MHHAVLTLPILWEIFSSVTTFLAFMGGHAVFLAPMAGIFASDYWLVKGQHIDVPALYDPDGRYRYNKYVINWRAVFAFPCAVCPNPPGLAYSIKNKTVHISQGVKNLYTFDWLYGFVTSIVIYTATSQIFKPEGVLVPHTIYGIPQDEEGSDQYAEQYDEKVLRKDSLVGNDEGFSNSGGLDSVGSAMHVRKSVASLARATSDIRISRSMQGGQGPQDGVPAHLRGVDEKELEQHLQH